MSTITTPVKSQDRIEKFNPNFDVSKNLWNKTAKSENFILSTVEKVAYRAAAVFTAIGEAFVNAAKLVMNVGISTANGIHRYFKPVKPVVAKQPPLSRWEKTRAYVGSSRVVTGPSNFVKNHFPVKLGGTPVKVAIK